MIIIHVDAKGRLWPDYLDVPIADYDEVAIALPRLAATLGAERLLGKIRQQPALIDAFTHAGWEITPDFVVTVYERPLA